MVLALQQLDNYGQKVDNYDQTFGPITILAYILCLPTSSQASQTTGHAREEPSRPVWREHSESRRSLPAKY